MNPPYDIIGDYHQNDTKRNRSSSNTRQHLADAQRSNFDPRDDRYFNISNNINSSLLSGDSVADRQAYGHVQHGQNTHENSRKLTIANTSLTYNNSIQELPSNTTVVSPWTPPSSSKPGSAKSVVNVDHRQQGVQSKIVATSVKAGLSELFGEQPTSPLPPSSMAKAAPSSVYEVAFKRLNSDYILHSRVVTPIAVGDLVVVSAERGCEDLGCVTRIRSLQEFMAVRMLPAVSPEGKPFNINKHTSKIVRLATVREQRMLGMKGSDEEDFRLYCQHVAINTFRLPITVTDVDFQFDRRKVTVYYSTAQAQQRVDFRDLVTHLSDVYKTRVWMVGS